MYSGGYNGRILKVDLSAGSVDVEPLSTDVAADYLGGAGFGIKFLFDGVPAKTDPLGPDNRLIFSSGPFTGTKVSCASRMAVTTKSPLTGAVGMALSGGHFPAELKMAGFDAIIIDGVAESPTYLLIKDDRAELRDARSLWGLTTSDTQVKLKDDLKDQALRIACIGPAGERTSKIACIINERRAAGRKGVGAVMGSKNLKAVAVRGTGEVPIANPSALKKAMAFMHNKMKTSPALYPEFAKTGTAAVAELCMAMGIFSARNFRDTGVFVPFEGLGMEAQNARSIGRNACYRCPVRCSQMKLAGGPYEGMLAEGPEFETLYSFGGTCGVDNLDAIIAADRLCDEYGLDTMSTGASIGFAMELYELGILTSSDTDGLDLQWGDHAVMLKLLKQIAYRQGFGEVLADGTKVAAERIGKGADRYAMHVKGLELPAYDVRGAKAHALNYATAYTGADHNRGYAFQEIFGVPVPHEVDRFSYEGKAALCKWNQDVRAVCCDCAPMCGFVLDTALADAALQNTSQLMAAVTGIALTQDDVYRVGERVSNLAKAFNVREGFTRADDTLPRRLMEEKIKDGLSRGHSISEDDLDIMLSEYYEARGWDQVTGLPTAATLSSLGLSAVADAIGLTGDGAP